MPWNPLPTHISLPSLVTMYLLRICCDYVFANHPLGFLYSWTFYVYIPKMHYLFNLKNLISRHEPQCVRKGQHRPCRPRLPGGDGLNSLGLNPAPASAPSEWLLCEAEAGSYMPLFCVQFGGRVVCAAETCVGAAVFSVSRLSSCCLQLQRRWGGRVSVFRSRGDSGLVRMSALHLPHVVI